jgi:hypothetical protein
LTLQAHRQTIQARRNQQHTAPDINITSTNHTRTKITKVQPRGVYDELGEKSRGWHHGCSQKVWHDTTGGVPGSMFGWFFTKDPVKNFADAKMSVSDKFR